MKKLKYLILFGFLLSIPLFSCGQTINFDKEKGFFSRNLEGGFVIGFPCEIFDSSPYKDGPLDDVEADIGGISKYVRPEYLHSGGGVWFEPNNKSLLYRGLPFTGKVFSLYSNGKKKWEYMYVNGKRDGFKITYFENGKIRSRVQFKNGLKEGVYESYCENGALDKRTYKNDKLNGVWEFYHPNGNIFLREYYIEGNADKTKTPFYDPSILVFDPERKKYKFWRNVYHN